MSFDISFSVIGAGEESIITGGRTKYHSDHSKSALKDNIMQTLMPDDIPECLGAAINGHCISKPTLQKIDNILNGGEGSKQFVGKEDTDKYVNIVNKAKEATQCDSELCILNKLEPQLGKQLIVAEITSNLKQKGPTDSNLLSNMHIDKIMEMFAELFPQFYPYNFNMKNYADYRFRRGYVESQPDTLATVQFRDLYGIGKNTCGCVINSDTYQGPGIHWMALFADARGDVWTVEFFNSSGGAPVPEWCNWMTKTKSQMEDIADELRKNPSKKFKPPTRIELVKCSDLQHQQSKTECGLYSLFYIYARLRGVPHEYFMKNPIPDQLMFEFRQHLFCGERGIVDGKFDWGKYINEVSVKWE